MRIERVLGLAACITALCGASVAAPKSTPVVKTHDGAVQGLVKDGTQQFLGIPFAAPPVGELRWRPPVAPDPWRGVKKTVAFSNSCPQGHDIGDFAKPSDTEDCLYLNVYVPAKASKRPRAVMLWFPGGALFAGAADDYDGAKLSRRGDIVLVTMNYRIGELGYFSHPAIDGEGHETANYGFMDQRFALQWIRDNIARFGGDPNNVTIAGQSAGGTAVIAQMLSPGSKGLFQKAIDESGGRMVMTTKADAIKIGEKFATDAGCPDQSAKCLRALSVQQIVAKQTGHYASATVDGVFIPMQPYKAFQSGQYNHVPVLNGVAGDEQGFFQAINEETQGPLTAAGYRDYVSRTFGAAHADEVMKLYPVETYASPSLAELAASQMFRGCVGEQLNRWWSAAGDTVYAYQFDDKSTPSYLKPKSFPLGAYHTVELVYLFPGFHGGLGTAHPLNKAQEKLSDGLVDAWANFTRTGDPNPTGVGPWPRYEAGKDNVQSFLIPTSQSKGDYGARYNCAVYDRITVYP